MRSRQVAIRRHRPSTHPERRPGRTPGLSDRTIAALVILVLAATVSMVYLSQAIVEKGALSPVRRSTDLRQQREVDKLDAEIRQIRSDTGGSLFWLKMAGIFVTVGTAVGGYLLGQSRNTHKRLELEKWNNVNALYQGIVQELSADSALLRAAAAAKLGKFLQSFPIEWDLTPERHAELRDLTKKVLAASLAIETEPKVLKTLTIAIALSDPSLEHGDLRAVDLSGARAADAYWARIDFTDADFYQADLTGASLRKAILSRAQFRDTKLNDAVLANAFCEEANFKFTDLRGADLSGAILRKASFEGAKVFGVKFDDGTTFGENPDHEIDVSETADGSQIMRFGGWLERSDAKSTS
jgi:uncharacterized protein YjbI with pentapeptide repeats